MVDIVEVSAIVTAAGVLVGIVYYLLEMRNQTRIRKTDMMVRLISTYSLNREYRNAAYDVQLLQIKNYEDFEKKYQPGSEGRREISNSITMVAGLFEMVGVLLYKGQIDLDTAYHSLGLTPVKWYYENLKPILIRWRRNSNDPSMYVGFEHLYNQFMTNEPELRKTLPASEGC